MSDGERPVLLARLMIALLATALLVRMILNGRITTYGYYQAALAGSMVPAILLGEMPSWIGAGRKGAAVIAIGTLALLVPGVVILSTLSHELLSQKTVPIGTGGDRFYASSSNLTGQCVDTVSRALRNGPRDRTLLVLPDGVMINYLARLPSPLVPNAYYSTALADGRESLLVAQLQRHPPDDVVFISHPLFDFGIQRWGGAQPGEGGLIFDWVTENYQIGASMGGDPLDPGQSGAIIFVHRPE